MKLLILPYSILFFISAQAHACTESTLSNPTTSYPLQCNTLTINASVSYPNMTSPIVIEVSGDVFINSSINLSAADGIYTDVDTTPGGAGGPGGSEGIGRGFNASADAPECPPYGPDFVACPFYGSKGLEDQRTTPTCDGGGSGAGFSKIGSSGSVCLNSGITSSLGGDLFDFSNIEIDLRGGFGGGPGGGLNFTAGGGGGGGAIQIISQGKITISRKGIILANGGAGANSSSINGAGGGGSGGVIILEAASFDLQGTLSAQGGAGGRAASGGHGGQGSPGLIRLKDPEGVKDFIGVKLPPKPMELKSSISCATIASSNEESSSSLLFQILVPLFACVGLSMIRKRFQSPV